MPGVEHRQHINNQLPPANPPTRTADEAVHVGPPRSALRLDPRANLFHFPRNQLTAADHRAARSQAFVIWAEIAGAQLAA
jgi:putative transposase